MRRSNCASFWRCLVGGRMWIMHNSWPFYCSLWRFCTRMYLAVGRSSLSHWMPTQFNQYIYFRQYKTNKATPYLGENRTCLLIVLEIYFAYFVEQINIWFIFSWSKWGGICLYIYSIIVSPLTFTILRNVDEMDSFIELMRRVAGSQKLLCVY